MREPMLKYVMYAGESIAPMMTESLLNRKRAETIIISIGALYPAISRKLLRSTRDQPSLMGNRRKAATATTAEETSGNTTVMNATTNRPLPYRRAITINTALR